MKHLLETMYILTPESYLYHRNGNICISIGGEEKASVPMSRVNSIVFFGKNTCSTSLLRFCSDNHITVVFLDPYGRFYARVCGAVNGNVLLRKKQYESLSDTEFCVQLVRDILYGKICNSKNVLMRRARTSDDCICAHGLYTACDQLSEMAQALGNCLEIDSMRGIEGAAANTYFSHFDDMLSSPKGYRFEVRSRRPPRNEVNAVLSFIYTQIRHNVTAALECVGLDPAAGYLHTLRPGRVSFTLDLMEELRAPLCDRFVLSLFNKGQLHEKDFDIQGDSVYLSDKGRKTVLDLWRIRQKDSIQHPFLKKKIEIGLIPYTQAMLFARVLRGDLDRYPPFIWR